MNCNFYSDHKSTLKRIDWSWQVLQFAIYLLGCTSVIFVLGLFFCTNFESELDFFKTLGVFLSFYPIVVIGQIYRRYKQEMKYYKETPKFTYKMFKDWYSLSPKRFIFDNDVYGFHYMINGNPDYVNEVFRVSSFSDKEWYRIDSNYNYLVPKTFLDYLRFTVFVEFLFRGLESKADKKRKIEIQKRNNEELLTVLNVVQSDIEKVLRDSQDILNKETKKLERCKNEL